MLPGVDDQLCFALYSASRAMTAAYAPLLSELGLTYPQYLAMLVLWKQDGIRVSQLGEKLALDSATLTPLLKRLETAGFVARTRSREDERVVEVTLTPAGKRLEKKAERVPACILEKSGLSIKQLIALRTELVELTAKLRAA